MPLESVDVTVVLNGHREGILIHRTLRSILRAIDFAADNNIRCEVVAVLDRVDQATADYFVRTGSPILRIVEVDCGDPGLARNRGVAEAAGEYIAFVDGDDLISRNWLTAAFAFAEEQRAFGRRLVLHPQMNIFFGEDASILVHVDQESPEWSLASLFAANYWTALLFARKDDLALMPYRSSCLDTGFGYEDWEWNCSAIGAGMIHKVVSDTWHFIRLKRQGSRNRIAQERDLLIRPLPVFDRLETECRVAPDPDMPTEPASDPDSVEDRILSHPKLLAEWRDLALLEPDVFPTREKLEQYRFWKPSRKAVGYAFGEILAQWGAAPSHVILCDSFAKGEVGLTALNYVRALTESGADVLVIAERPSRVSLSYGSNGSVRILDFGKLVANIEPYWHSRLLAQALMQRPPRTIHLHESKLGYEAIALYGSPICHVGVSRIFASIPLLERDPEGEYASHIVSYFDRIAPCLSGLLSDNYAVLDWFCDMFGFPRDKCHMVRAGVYPSTVFPAVSYPRLAGKPMALWVGDHGQRACPGTLLQIARLMPDWSFAILQQVAPRFPWSDELQAMLLSLPNVVWAKQDASLTDSNRDESVLLYTSLVQGLPQVLIQAAAGGLPIVAPALAGIREFVNDDTGYMVADYYQPEAYVDCLREVVGDKRRAVRNAQSRLRDHYSWSKFKESVQLIAGYL